MTAAGLVYCAPMSSARGAFVVRGGADCAGANSRAIHENDDRLVPLSNRLETRRLLSSRDINLNILVSTVPSTGYLRKEPRLEMRSTIISHAQDPTNSSYTDCTYFSYSFLVRRKRDLKRNNMPGVFFCG